MTERRIVAVEDVELEVFLGGELSSAPMVCAAHPAGHFGAAVVELLADMAGVRVMCVNPREFGESERSATPSLDQMVDRIEGVRRRVGVGRWIFWGMSGGGWLAQIYARRYPDALAGIVIESACLCFRERLADAACILSPFLPAWRKLLRTAGLLSEDSHLEPSQGDDTGWVEIDGVGDVFRRRDGPALLVSPDPVAPEMKAVMPHLWQFDSRPWIRSVHLPALVLCGTADPVVPLHHARAVHDAITGSVFAEVVGGGHVPVAHRRPEVTNAFQNFVSGLGPEI